MDISGQTHGPPIVPEPFTTEYPPLEEGGTEREILLPGTAQSDGKGILSLSYRVGFRQVFIVRDWIYCAKELHQVYFPHILVFFP